MYVKSYFFWKCDQNFLKYILSVSGVQHWLLVIVEFVVNSTAVLLLSYWSAIILLSLQCCPRQTADTVEVRFLHSFLFAMVQFPSCCQALTITKKSVAI